MPAAMPRSTTNEHQENKPDFVRLPWEYSDGIQMVNANDY